MPCATITISGPTTYLDLYTLLRGNQPGPPSAVQPIKPITGYTVQPPQGILGTGVGQRISFLSIQASSSNGGSVYIGDANLNPGTCQGMELAAGQSTQRWMRNVTGLGEIYLGGTGSVNVELYWE